MLWKDFKQAESCDDCPLLADEICPGGWKCYGGEPIEPPCCGFDDNTDLDEWAYKHLEQQEAWEEKEAKQIRAERKKKERAQKAADTRKAIRWYCRDEIFALKRAQKALQAQKAAENFAHSFAEAMNFTNEAFRYKERVQVKPEVSDKTKQLEAEVIAAKKRYDEKRKEFYASRKKSLSRGEENG